MLNKINSKMTKVSAAVVTGMMIGSAPASANNFSSIGQNVQLSVSSLPGLLTALAYVLGIMKIKDHVENPGQTPLKDGAIRLAAGGALFALPIVFEAMQVTTDNGGGANATTAAVNQATFNVM